MPLDGGRSIGGSMGGGHHARGRELGAVSLPGHDRSGHERPACRGRAQPGRCSPGEVGSIRRAKWLAEAKGHVGLGDLLVAGWEMTRRLGQPLGCRVGGGAWVRAISWLPGARWRLGSSNLLVCWEQRRVGVPGPGLKAARDRGSYQIGLVQLRTVHEAEARRGTIDPSIALAM